MGNGVGVHRRPAVEDRYTRPQGLYEPHRDVDLRRLRRLILDGKLAPCYPGRDDPGALSGDLEDCPICFLHYPSLNRSKCCGKSICTECYLQMKSLHATRVTQCPFCKSPSYVVEYRGVKSKEEKAEEQQEEQRVIEAQIRIRNQELDDEAEKNRRRKSVSSSVAIPLSRTVYHDLSATSQSAPYTTNGGGFHTTQPPYAASAGITTPPIRPTSDEDLDDEWEKLMISEAIFRSLQDRESEGNIFRAGSLPSSRDEIAGAMNPSGVPPSGGLASALAAMAEEQHKPGGGSSSTPPARDVPHRPERPHAGNKLVLEAASPVNLADETSSRRSSIAPTERWSEMAEVGTSRTSSVMAIDRDLTYPPPEVLPQEVPDSFEDQMRLAVAMSLAETHRPQGRTWMH